jgi:hypothetical protein
LGSQNKKLKLVTSTLKLMHDQASKQEDTRSQSEILQAFASTNQAAMQKQQETASQELRTLGAELATTKQIAAFKDMADDLKNQVNGALQAGYAADADQRADWERFASDNARRELHTAENRELNRELLRTANVGHSPCNAGARYSHHPVDIDHGRGFHRHYTRSSADVDYRHRPHGQELDPGHATGVYRDHRPPDLDDTQGWAGRGTEPEGWPAWGEEEEEEECDEDWGLRMETSRLSRRVPGNLHPREHGRGKSLSAYTCLS